jgi:hypothetical protein
MLNRVFFFLVECSFEAYTWLYVTIGEAKRCWKEYCDGGRL